MINPKTYHSRIKRGWSEIEARNTPTLTHAECAKRNKAERKPFYLYAVYRDDEFIDVGTAQELAERLNVTRKAIYHYANQHHHDRVQPGWKYAVKIGDYEEELE